MKTRVDLALVQRGQAPSREKAQALIMAGQVYVGERKVLKASEQVEEQEELILRGEIDSLASRGGHKIERAMEVFQPDVTGVVAMDIGAAAGGFTDVLLQHGARKVYAVDVGYGQLAWKLRSDPRVVNMERTNIRSVTPDMIPDILDFASIDVAFISLEKVLPATRELLKPEGEIVALIKPQFEAGREHVGKKGVVRDPAIHLAVIRRVLSFSREHGFSVRGLTFSPVKGPEGNIEYLAWLSMDGSRDDAITDDDMQRVVGEAHAALDV